MPLNLTDFNHFYIINKVCGLEKQRHYLEALGRKEFQIYFQPKISGKSQKIASAEVLIRWKRADGELWFPDSFLPILEETGEIEALDYYVYEAAFQWLANRRSAGLNLLPLSLNVSPVHFRKIHTFTKKVLQLIQKYEIPSDEVKIDKRFLSDDLTEKGKIVLQEIFHLLKRTNKFIVCEGVETKEMVDFLIQEGCDELQGYYYYKPMEMGKFEELIA